MLNPSIYSLKNKDIKRALKRLFQIEIIKVSSVLRLKKCPLVQNLKLQRQKLGFFDQMVEAEIVPSIYSWSFCFFDFSYFIKCNYTANFIIPSSIYDIQSSPFLNFSPFPVFPIFGSEIIGNCHLSHRPCF
jgi:hypothetical protein